MRPVILAVPVLLAAGATGLVFDAVHLEVDDAPRQLDAADLDGDGDLDLIVLADGPGLTAGLQVLLNERGDFVPGWSAVDTTHAGAAPWDLDLADVDGDGDLDLLYVRPLGSPRQRFNDGAAAFDEQSSVPSFAFRAHQAVADLDVDGDPDVVYFEADIIPYLGTLVNDGGGGYQYDFANEISSGLGFSDLAVRMVLGDGLADAALAGRSGLRFVAGKPPLAGSDLPGWMPGVQVHPAECLDVVLVDLDGDGRLDTVTSVPAQHAVLVLLTTATGGFGAPRLHPAGLGPDALAAADLDGDGHADVIAANPRTRSVSVLRGTGDGGLLAPRSLQVGRRPTDVVAADLDDDGDLDLAVACAGAGSGSGSGHVTLLINDSP